MSNPPKHFSMIRGYHLADVFTLANGASGTAAIFCAMSIAAAPDAGSRLAQVWLAGGLIAAALVFDVLDGRIARIRQKASPMGRELDSLSDVISFGVAPAALARALGCDGALDTAILLYFVACGISRLARYNITADAIAAEGGAGKVKYFEGTPIPTSIVLVILLVALAATDHVGANLPLGATLGGALHWTSLLFAVSGSLMISKTIRIPKP